MFALKTYSAECRNSLTQEGLAPGQPNGQYQFATLSAGKPNKMPLRLLAPRGQPRAG